MNPIQTINREQLWKFVGLALWIFSVTTVGCGGPAPLPRFPVSGEVTFDSKPLPLGDIIFEPEDRNLPANGGLITNGKYNIKAVAGKYQVKITASREIPGKTIPGPSGGTIPATEGYIPEKYNSNTELTTAVYPLDSNSINFDLTSESK